MSEISMSGGEYDGVQQVVSRFMEGVKQSLGQVILSLQSDQLLEQMRNDHNLYRQKQTYIQEMIQSHFVFQNINEGLLRQIDDLRHNKEQLQRKGEEAQLEYIEELNNIEKQYREFLKEKESQQKSMLMDIEHKDMEILKLKEQLQRNVIKFNDEKDSQINRLEEKITHINQAYTQLKSQLDMAEKDNRQLIADKEKITKKIHQLQRQLNLTSNEHKNSQLQNTLTELRQQLAHSQSQLALFSQKQQQYLQAEQHYSQTQQQYLQAIEKMKEDMMLIKSEWEKKCMSIQSELSEQYRLKLIQHQKTMNQQLLKYMEELKMGRSVIIQSSEEILQSKKAIMQQHFDEQLNEYSQQIQGYEKELKQKSTYIVQIQERLKLTQQALKSNQEQTQSTIAQLQDVVQNTKQKLSQQQEQFSKKLLSVKTQTDKELQRLRKTQIMLLRDIKTLKSQKDQLHQQLTTTKDQLTNVKQKLLSQTKKNQELKNAHDSQTTKILQLKKDLAIYIEKSTLDQRTIKDKNQQINRLETHLNNSKNQYKQLDHLVKKLQLKLAEHNLKLKEQQRLKTQCIHKTQKAYLLVRKLAKQLNLVKQDIQFQINSQKTKFQTILMSMSQQLHLRDQTIKYNHKNKIQQLLQQVEMQKKQERQEIEDLLRENNNIKKQVKLLQQLLKQKQQDYLYEKERIVNLEVQKCRLVMQDEISREKDGKRKLQEKLYNQEKHFDYLIAKAEKQTFKNIKLFLSKWQHKLQQTQQALQLKDQQLNDLSQKFKRSLQQIQSLKSEIQQKEERLTKQERKYETLKQQRDKTIDQMMRRLEKETKHKIALEREMKEIRCEIMKTQTHSNNNSPFNNYSFTDRENTNVYTNAFQPSTQDRMKTQVKATNREKELSEIREMIAKTYKVVEGAEKDSPLHSHKGKLF